MSAINENEHWAEHTYKEVEDYVEGRFDSIEERLTELDWGDALTFEAATDGVTVWAYAYSDALGVPIDFSTDGGRTWSSRMSLQGGNPLATLNSGETLKVRGTHGTGMYDETEGIVFNTCALIPTDDCYVYGNIMSLVAGENYKTANSVGQGQLSLAFHDDRNNVQGNHILSHPTKKLLLPATTLANYCYSRMFSHCTALTAAPELPATTLANYCYSGMFSGCTSLTTAPELPATTLAIGCYASMFHNCTSLTTAQPLSATTMAEGSCYDMFENCTSLTSVPALLATTLAPECCYGMFSGCTSLTTAPALPATTLAIACYSGMFSRCTSLTAAPELPATTLANGCYYIMFSGCTALASVTCLATDISASNALQYWLQNVSATGTFTKAAGVNWPTGVSGIPSGWTVVEASS